MSQKRKSKLKKGNKQKKRMSQIGTPCSNVPFPILNQKGGLGNDDNASSFGGEDLNGVIKTPMTLKIGKKIRELIQLSNFCLPSDDLLLQGRWPQLPSALESLTSVFGMGTGVSSPPLSLGKLFNWTCTIISI
jgi:hypothetical protein